MDWTFQCELTFFLLFCFLNDFFFLSRADGIHTKEVIVISIEMELLYSPDIVHEKPIYRKKLL